MQVTKAFITAVAPNAAAAKSGADLAAKKQLTALLIDPDKVFIAGECKGSGAKPYRCSADFIHADAPVYRCTCPSRQIPCKHVLALLSAYCAGQPFAEGRVPDDILEKREKAEKRAAKKEEAAQTPEKPKTPAQSAAKLKTAIKKIEAQCTGLGEAEKLLQNMTRTGLGAIDAQSLKNYAAAVKQLDSYYITGIQDMLNDLLGLLQFSEGERDFVPAVEQINQLHIIISRCEAYLQQKKETAQPDTQSELEELMGYPWKLQELDAFGLFEENAELLQLGFHERNEIDKKRYVDEGFFISLHTGKIVKTRNYRPYKALKHIKEEDSTAALVKVPRLYLYPSLSVNPRARWDSCAYIAPDAAVYPKIKAHGADNFAAVVKTVKNQLKDIMLSRNPVVLVNFSELSPYDDGGTIGWMLKDTQGNRLTLAPTRYCAVHFMELLCRLTPSEKQNQCMALLFENDIESGRLTAQPVALITDDRLQRFIY